MGKKETDKDKLVYIEDSDPHEVLYVEESGHKWTRQEVNTPTPDDLEHEARRLDIKTDYSGNGTASARDSMSKYVHKYAAEKKAQADHGRATAEAYAERKNLEWDYARVEAKKIRAELEARGIKVSNREIARRLKKGFPTDFLKQRTT
jgi:hypothetical protein